MHCRFIERRTNNNPSTFKVHLPTKWCIQLSSSESSSISSLLEWILHYLAQVFSVGCKNISLFRFRLFFPKI